MPGEAEIQRVVLSDGNVSVALLSLGCITQDWQVPLNGELVPVLLGYRDPKAYHNNPAFLGVIVGRLANRIAGATFTLEGQSYALPANDGPNHLHGGPGGLASRFWQVDRDGTGRARFRYYSPDGEGGYPGAIEFELRVTLQGHTLTYDMRAMPDRPTPISMAQHNYYALTGGITDDQHLTIAADAYTPVNAELIPTGQIAPLTGQSFDFRSGRTLGMADPERAGLDHNYVLNRTDGPAVTLRAPNGLTLKLHTDQPGLQLFTAAQMGRFAEPLPGQVHAPFSGVCFEPQGFPNAVNTPAFPSVIATPDAPYRQMLSVTVGANGTE